jgi:hypothetical protein
VTLAAIVAAVGFVGIAIFQLALAFGAPLGRAAWGGANRVLPPRLRRASAVSCLVWLVAVVIILWRAGLIEIAALPSLVPVVGTWVLVVLSAVGALVNVASSSPWERLGWAPYAGALALLSLVVALGPSPA